MPPAGKEKPEGEAAVQTGEAEPRPAEAAPRGTERGRESNPHGA